MKVSEASEAKWEAALEFDGQVKGILELIPRLPSPLNMIGNTPLIRLHALERFVERRVEIYGKAEWFNPGGSVKDRPALWMILDAKLKGKSRMP